MQRFEDVFSKYIEKSVTHPALLAGEVTGIQIATEENAVQISMAAGALIPYAAVAEAQRTLAMGLAARSVTILVHYPQQLLGEDAFRLILDYLKAENGYGIYVVSGVVNYLALRTETAYRDENEIGQLCNGEMVNVLETNTGNPEYWYVYVLSSGKYGYVNKNYLV